MVVRYPTPGQDYWCRLILNSSLIPTMLGTWLHTFSIDGVGRIGYRSQFPAQVPATPIHGATTGINRDIGIGCGCYGASAVSSMFPFILSAVLRLQDPDSRWCLHCL